MGRKAVIRFVRKLVGRKHNINTREYWNGIWQREGLESRGNVVLHSRIIELISTGSRVLDVGCGNGQLLRFLAQNKTCSAVGIELSDWVLGQLRTQSIDGICCALPHIACKSGLFDMVLCTEALEHINKPHQAIKEMHRVAKPGGLILFSVPDGCLWGEGGEHVFAFKPTDCVQMLRPFVDRVNLETIQDAGHWPFLLCWGRTIAHPHTYAIGQCSIPQD